MLVSATVLAQIGEAYAISGARGLFTKFTRDVCAALLWHSLNACSVTSAFKPLQSR
jgi:hypothetical protein